MIPERERTIGSLERAVAERERIIRSLPGMAGNWERIIPELLPMARSLERMVGGECLECVVGSQVVDCGLRSAEWDRGRVGLSPGFVWRESSGDPIQVATDFRRQLGRLSLD